jgi:hypothetical protein
MERGDVDQDGRVELILGGVNNRHHSATVVVLDPDNVSGTTRPIVDPRVPDHRAFRLLKYGDDEDHLATCLWAQRNMWSCFPAATCAFKASGNCTITTASTLFASRRDCSRYSLRSTSSRDPWSTSCTIWTWRLNVVAAKPSKEFQDLQWERFQKKTLDHAFSQRDVDQIEKMSWL